MEKRQYLREFYLLSDKYALQCQEFDLLVRNESSAESLDRNLQIIIHPNSRSLGVAYTRDKLHFTGEICCYLAPNLVQAYYSALRVLKRYHIK